MSVFLHEPKHLPVLSFEQGKTATQQGGGLEDSRDLQGIQREKVGDEEKGAADIKTFETRRENTNKA